MAVNVMDVKLDGMDALWLDSHPEGADRTFL
jgi:hypothetical protein